MNNLIQYGWTHSLDQYYNSLQTDLMPGRVVSITGYKYHLVNSRGELETELSGKLLFESEPTHLPKVGDWVLYIDYDTTGYIVEVLPRVNTLSRKTPGRRIQKQILAANIDTALIVQGMDRDFNLMRLDRYITQITSCGIAPVIILNKADLVGEPSKQIAEVESLRRDCPVFACSARSGSGLNEICSNVILPGKTFILVGSSGVGKSSLLNALINNVAQPTAAVSEATQKGRHTTTTRDLFFLPNGAMIIDTPGMREFGITFDDEMSDTGSFPVIEELASACRFTDCLHVKESGCAVLHALEDGTLDPIIYESYIKLVKEQRRFQISVEEKKQQNKMFSRLTKEAKQHRKKYKY